MNIAEARFNMIEQQIRPWNVLALDILELLSVMRREEFVPAAYKRLAFSDTEIPLSGGENMLEPKIEARLLQEAQVKKHEQVLEIGSGSGHMAALLSYKARHITTVEINPELKTLAETNLAVYGIINVDVALGNGAQGWDQGPSQTYDVIFISGSLPTLPDAFLKQLNVCGRVVTIIGEAPVMSAQIVTRNADNSYSNVHLFETNIKPLREAAAHSHFKF